MIGSIVPAILCSAILGHAQDKPRDTLNQVCAKLEAAKSYSFGAKVKSRESAIDKVDGKTKAKTAHEDLTRQHVVEIEVSGAYQKGKPAYLQSEDCEVYVNSRATLYRTSEDAAWSTGSSFPLCPRYLANKPAAEVVDLDDDEATESQRMALLLSFPIPHRLLQACENADTPSMTYTEDPGVFEFERTVYELEIDPACMATTAATLRPSGAASAFTRPADTSGTQSSTRTKQIACLRVLCYEGKVQEIEVYLLDKLPGMPAADSGQKRGQQLNKLASLSYRIDVSHLDDAKVELPKDLPTMLPELDGAVR